MKVYHFTMEIVFNKCTLHFISDDIYHHMDIYPVHLVQYYHVIDCDNLDLPPSMTRPESNYNSNLINYN